jgi:NitT/TauT family transport system substrate-binding protein
MRNLRKLAFPLAAVALAAAACSSSGTPASTAPKDPVKLTISISNVTNQTYLAVVLAQQLGYFKQQGIDLTIQNVTTGSQNFTEMLAGQVQGVVGIYDHTIDLQAKGQSVESVMTLNQAPGFAILVRSDEASSITSAAQLAGKNVGITGTGSSTQFVLNGVVQHAGGNASTIKPVNVAAGATFISAVQNDEVDAGITSEPTISALLNKHAANILVDLRTTAGTEAALGGPYVGTSLIFPTAYVKAHATTVQEMVNALHESLKYIQTHSASNIVSHMPAADYAATGETAYTQALANEIGIFSPTGLMVQDGPQSVERILSTFDTSVKGKTINLSLTYTNTFVQNVPSGD